MNKLNEVVVVAAKRTSIGTFMGGLSSVNAPQLGAVAIKGALESIQLDPKEVDEVFMGQVLQSGVGQAPARQAALLAGIPNTTPCTTVNKVCSSGMKAVSLASQAIRLGDISIAVVGGMENMSLAPHLFQARKGVKFGSSEMQDSMQKDGLVDAYDQVAMGVFADKTAEKYQISREEQDAFAVESYRRSQKAWEEKKFDNEIVPVTIPNRRGGDTIIDEDEEYKNVMIEKIPKLRPAFSKEGTVTAANASTINDGAAALILMSKQKAEELGIEKMVSVLSYADAAQEPEWFTTAPALALPKALSLANLTTKEVDYFELNEAFSVVGIANTKLLNLSADKVNVHGGAVSLGHPLGCSGARIIVTLIHTLLQNKESKIGAAALCNGGGGASAMVFSK